MWHCEVPHRLRGDRIRHMQHVHCNVWWWHAVLYALDYYTRKFWRHTLPSRQQDAQVQHHALPS